MSYLNNKFSFGVVALTLSMAAVGMAKSAGDTVIQPEPIRCEIDAQSKNGMVKLQGLVHSDPAIEGAYEFSVESYARGGQSSIKQGGAFSSEAGQTSTVGNVMLGGSGTSYEVTLNVRVDGKTLTCVERIGEV